MTAQVKVIVEGYADFRKGVVWATTSVVLDGNIVMVVDPGTVSDQRIIVEGLKQAGVAVDDVNTVCVTHSHLDHYRNIGMFAGAQTIEYWGRWNGSLWEYNTDSRQVSENIRLVLTPGHSYDGISLLVETQRGIIALCGDVFWYKNGPATDPIAVEPDSLDKSRKMLIQKADWIVPGHGGMFKVE